MTPGRAGLRIDRSTQQQPVVVFAALEAAVLMTGLIERYELPIYRSVKVHRDHHRETPPADGPVVSNHVAAASSSAMWSAAPEAGCRSGRLWGKYQRRRLTAGPSNPALATTTLLRAASMFHVKHRRPSQMTRCTAPQLRSRPSDPSTALRSGRARRPETPQPGSQRGQRSLRGSGPSVALASRSHLRAAAISAPQPSPRRSPSETGQRG